MVKKLMKGLALLFLLCSLIVAQPSYAKDINIIIDGESLQTDQAPIIHKGRTMVPLRSIFEALGAEVQWYPASGLISCYRDYTYISLTVNDTHAFINGNTVTIDAPPIIINGRTLVPVRVVSEALGANVGWNTTSCTVEISSNDGYVGVMRVNYDDLLPDNLSIIPSDYFDTAYINGNYVNTTPYPILGYSLSYMDRSTTETHSLLTYDTVLSGEASPLLNSTAPKSKKLSDVQFQDISVTFKTPYGKFYVTYDYRLGEIESLLKVS